MARPLDVDLTGKTCVVTGATAGIGKEVARGLARRGATVYFPSRTPERGEATRDELRRDAGHERVDWLEADLAAQESTRAFAADVRERAEKLDVLVNNAGVWLPERRLTSEGIETTWATNALAYHLLSLQLLDLLRAGAPARIVNVASGLANGLDLDDLSYERRRYDGLRAYAQSKQADRMLSWALARRLEGSGVTVNACHPGTVSTELTRAQRGVMGALAGLTFTLFGQGARHGADTPLWLAASPEVEGVTGRYWVKRRERPCQFRDPAEQEALWRRCLQQTGEEDVAAARQPG